MGDDFEMRKFSLRVLILFQGYQEENCLPEGSLMFLTVIWPKERGEDVYMRDRVTETGGETL